MVTSTKDTTDPNTCHGCGETIDDGQGGIVTVESGRTRVYVISVPAHDNDACRDAAHRNTMARTDWKQNQSYRAD